MFNPRKQRASDKKEKVTTAYLSQPLATERAHPAQSTPTQASNMPNNICSIFSDGIIGINKDGKINFINKIACKLTGWSQTEAVKQSIEELFQLTTLSKDTVAYVIKTGQLFSPMLKQEIRTKDNTAVLVNFSISPLNKDSAILMLRQHQQDENKQMPALPYQANYDALTRLLNRNALQACIRRLHHKSRLTEETYSLLLLNIDRFKLVNDRFGQLMGDRLLQLIAERIQCFIRDNDIAGRWTGGEFLCILPETRMDSASQIAERLRKNLCETAFVLEQHEIFISTSIGVSNFPLDGNNPEELFCIADATLYEAKRKGSNRVQNNTLLKNSIFSIGSQLENAINTKKIIPVHQSIVDLKSGEKVAEETLARIQEPDGSLIEAGDFIDAAVKLQLIHRIDYTILCSTISRCCIHFVKNKPRFPYFVNVSADFLRRPELVQQAISFAKKEFKIYGLDRFEKKPIVLEITEQELLHDLSDVNKTLNPFIELGFDLAIDDFGSGYSSLTYLSDLPISYLKYDGSLIQRITTEERARKIITGIQLMAESLELITIAEHIEDEETLKIIQDIGVTWGQGYYYARPEKALNYFNHII